MLIRRPPTIRPSEITPEAVFLDRREALRRLGGAGVAAALGPGAALAATSPAAPPAAQGAALTYRRNPKYVAVEKANTYEDITTYNNFYEFGLDKSDPAHNAGTLRTRPWTVEIAGEADVTGRFAYEDILKPHPLEERIYRHRCVEAWSMVIPWVGFPLADLIQRFRPNSKAKYVEFTSLADPKQEPGVAQGYLNWPYVEGLRMDEAMHPLTLMVVGLYGRELPNQNGAPLRVHVPWKYGFKSGKSIVKIRFTATQPRNTWAVAAPSEYGFYANVNPMVDHPRWSQATERVIGGGFFAARKPTQMFNGYAEDVASLYQGMDLRRNF